MVSVQYRSAVGAFTTRSAAEQALKHLYCAGFPITRLSLVSKDTELLEQLEEAIRKTQSRDNRTSNAPCAMITGSMVGALGGCLMTIGILSIPGVAPAIAIGSAVGTALASTLAGAGIGLATGGVISVCNCPGVSSERANDSDERLSPEEYLVIVNGTEQEVQRAKKLLAVSQ